MKKTFTYITIVFIFILIVLPEPKINKEENPFIVKTNIEKIKIDSVLYSKLKTKAIERNIPINEIMYLYSIEQFKRDYYYRQMYNHIYKKIQNSKTWQKAIQKHIKQNHRTQEIQTQHEIQYTIEKNYKELLKTLNKNL